MNRDIASALDDIFRGIAKLQACCTNGRKFTIDGRLVGDVGGLFAARDFDITLDRRSRARHDAVTNTCGRDVQIKATFKDHLSFGKEPVLYLGLKLERDGTYEVIFNGPGHVLSKAFERRKGCGEKLISFPIKKLQELNKTLVAPENRVPLRK